MSTTGLSELEQFVMGLKEASTKIKEINPAVVIAPMRGAIPFIDVLAIIDRDFDYNSVEYLPASSAIDNITEVMQDWYLNFLDEMLGDDVAMFPILAIDEAISGSSAVRGYHNFRKALSTLAKRRFSSESKQLADDARGLNEEQRAYIVDFFARVPYKTICIEEAREGQRRHNTSYRGLINRGIAIPIPVPVIPTMDTQELCTVRYTTAKDTKNGSLLFKPTIEGFTVTSAYIRFLQDVARIVGVNPDGVSPVNLSKIKQSERYVSEIYK